MVKAPPPFVFALDGLDRKEWAANLVVKYADSGISDVQPSAIHEVMLQPPIQRWAFVEQHGVSDGGVGGVHDVQPSQQQQQQPAQAPQQQQQQRAQVPPQQPPQQQQHEQQAQEQVDWMLDIGMEEDLNDCFQDPLILGEDIWAVIIGV